MLFAISFPHDCSGSGTASDMLTTSHPTRPIGPTRAHSSLGLVSRAIGSTNSERWSKDEGNWRLEVVKRSDNAEGLVVLPWRWIIERTLAWIDRFRRLCKEYERKVQT